MDQVGGRLEELEMLHTRFLHYSQEVEQLTQNLDSTVMNTTWWGDVADWFRRDWESEFKPSLRRLVEALEDAHALVRSRKEGLQQVSSVSGSGTTTVG
jgi:uncharacterized protein YukE